MAGTAGNSKWIQINDYLLVEFEYTSLVDPEKINTADFGWRKVENGYFDTNQIFNEDAAEDETGNVQDRSVVQIAGNRFAHLDIDRINNYLDIDTELTGSDISFTPNIDVSYDTIRFHVLAGYNFEDLDGVILQVLAREISGNDLTLLQIGLLKTENIFTLNPKPIFLGDRLYDKYIEAKIPALKIVIDEYEALDGSALQEDTFIAKVTSDGGGLIRNRPIRISAININTSEEIDNQLYFNIGQTATGSVNQTDEFALFTAVIQESASGDYFEYFGSFDGGFAEDFITNLNNMGNSYIMIHELEVNEQISSNYTSTANFASIQSSGYDEANLYRPIILNAESAVSFTIDYQIRLFNRLDNTQIIKKASITSFDVSKWGRELLRLNLRNDPEATDVFNKVVEGTTIANTIIDSANQNLIQTKYVPTFFNKKLISIRRENLFMDSDGNLVTSKGDNDRVIFGQGEAQIIVDPFDTFVKFIIFTSDNRDNQPIPMDLGNNAEYNLVFINNKDNKIYVKQETNVDFSDQTKGELLFRITSDTGIKFSDYTNREFFIISINDDGVETKIYQGEGKTPNEFQDAREKEEVIGRETKRKENKRILDLEAQLEKQKLKLQQASLSNRPQGLDPERIRLKPSRTQGGSIAEGGFTPSKIEVPGLATSNVTVSPVQLIQPNQEVLDSKSDKFQKERNAKIRRNRRNKRENS